MKKHLNTLYVTRDDSLLSKDGESVSISRHGQRLLRLPLHNLEAIQTFGWNIAATPQLLADCAERGICVSQCNPHGKLLYRISGFSHGNVLLRRQQYRVADSEQDSLNIARNMVSAKILNARLLLQRQRRDHSEACSIAATELSAAEHEMARCARLSRRAATSAELLGLEGNAAEAYFSVFSHCLQVSELRFTHRNRRPPKDPVNALLSFAYTLLAHDCRSALEAVGLDAAVGFYHKDRPGRPSLALDLMEELRAPLADRLALTLINRRQISISDFSRDENGCVWLSDDAKRCVLTHWQERKADTIMHPFLNEKISIGMIPHIQARLLAHHVRGSLDAYPPMYWH